MPSRPDIFPLGPSPPPVRFLATQGVIALKLEHDAPTLDGMPAPSVDPPSNPGRGALSFVEIDFGTDRGRRDVFGNTPVAAMAASVRKPRQLLVVRPFPGQEMQAEQALAHDTSAG